MNTNASPLSIKENEIMKKAFSTIVAALVAVSFAGIVCAAEPAKKEAAPAALPAGHPPVAAEKAPAKPAKKAKKAKKAEKKEEAAPAATPAAPAAPAAPAKK
jgi:hypothetical protein